MIPKELQERKQWICWKYEKVPGRAKPTKIPYNPVTGFKAKSSDASTWTDFATAKANMSRYSGIGFVFTKDDPYVGIDLDAVLDKDGKFIQKDAQEIFDKANSYTEISPSGTGIHIIGKAHLRDGKPRKVEENEELGTCEKEVYEFGRYFTVTGHQMGDCNEVNDVQDLTNMLEDRMLEERNAKNGKAKDSPAKGKTSSVTQGMKEAAVRALDQENNNAISPGLMKFTKMVYPNEPNQVKLAAKVEKMLNEVQITRVVKSKDLFVDFTRNGMKHRAIIRDEGQGFHIPEDPVGQKAYIYGRLIRYIDRTLNKEKAVSLSDMHEATRALVNQVRKDSLEKGLGSANERIKISLHELGHELNKKPADLWNEIRVDMARVPSLSKTIQTFKGLSEMNNNSYLMVSKEIETLFKEDLTRAKEQKVTQVKENDKEVAVSQTREAKREEAPISSKFFRPVVRDLYISSEQKAMFTWLEDRGVRCKAMSADELDDKQLINCSMDGVDFRGKTCKGMTIKDSAIDEIHVDSKSDLSQVEFEKCRFSSSVVFDRVVAAKAVIKNCMVREERVIEGEKKMLWGLQNASDGKRQKDGNIQCLSMPGSRGKISPGRGGFER